MWGYMWGMRILGNVWVLYIHSTVDQTPAVHVRHDIIDYIEGVNTQPGPRLRHRSRPGAPSMAQ